MAIAALISALTMLAGQPAIMLAQAAPPPPAVADAAGEDPFPSGAPIDDYGFMSWCYGALAGHLDLYDRVLPEVKRIETEFPDNKDPIDKVMASYAAQHDLGKRILEGYGKALDIEEATGKTGGQDRAAGVTMGRTVWTGSEGADARQLAQVWMSWALPGRCQSTAARLNPGAVSQ